MRIRLKPLPEKGNKDMVRLDDERGIAYAIVHRDLFWNSESGSSVYKALRRGEEVLVELRIVEE